MEELEAQVRDELSAITNFLENRLGRRSRWDGEVELSDDASVFGKALWSGRVVVNRAVAQTDLRWRTEIHEALHLFSVGLTSATYVELRGWEEGVVEQLQRQLRPDIFRSLNIRIPEAVFLVKEAGHRYNRFIKALEDLRLLLGETPEQFYSRLLEVPLTDRPATVMAAGVLLPPDDVVLFRRTFAISFSLLRRE
jgi:hypothetical protein